MFPRHGAVRWACDSRAVKARSAGPWRRPPATAVARVPAEPAERRPPVARRKESQHPAGPMVCRAARRRPPSMAATATIPQASMPARVTMGPLTCLPMKPAPVPRSSGRSAMQPFGVPSRGSPCACGRTAVPSAVPSARGACRGMRAHRRVRSAGVCPAPDRCPGCRLAHRQALQVCRARSCAGSASVGRGVCSCGK